MVRRTGLGTAAALAALMVFTGGLLAQDGAGQVWIQIEARNNQTAAEERLQRWSAELPGVTGFRLSSGWVAVTLGPFAPEDARARLSELRNAGVIPADSYIPDNRLLREQVWPPEGGAVIAPVQVTPLQPVPAVPAPSGTAPSGTGPSETAPVEQTPAQARAYEAGLSREARMEIQAALKWAGVYRAGVDGAFGPGTRSAISAWQAQQGATQTGVLNTVQTNTLVGAWKAEVAALGLETVRDEEAGISAQLPLRLVRFDRYAPPYVLYGAQNDSGLELRLISLPGDADTLAAFYHDLLASDLVPPGSLGDLTEAGFTLTGTTEEVEVQVTVTLAGTAIRGWLLRGARADSARNARVLQALAQDFRGLGQQVLDPGLVPLEAGLRDQLQIGLRPPAPRAALSGFYIDPTGSVMTALAPIAGCRSLTLGQGSPARISWSDEGLGLAVLRPEVPLAPPVLGQFSAALPGVGSEAVLSGYSFGAALSLPLASFGRVEAGPVADLAPARAVLHMASLPGDAGGAVLGEDGLVTGVLLGERDMAGRHLPEGTALMVPSPQILSALQAAGMNIVAGPAAEGIMAPEDLSRMGAELAVQVVCRD